MKQENDIWKLDIGVCCGSVIAADSLSLSDCFSKSDDQIPLPRDDKWPFLYNLINRPTIDQLSKSKPL